MQPTPHPPQGHCVLVVEDNPLQMAQLRAHLAAHGHHVMEARNGAEAILRLQYEHPDLILSDCVMPLLDGYQLCRLVKDDRATRHIPVVLLTSEGNHLSAFWARVCGADKFLLKGPDLERLVGESVAVVRHAPRPRVDLPPRRLASEELTLEAIQRRLGLALEHRLLETSLRDAVEKLYTMTGDTMDLVGHFLALVQDLVLPGAALVVFHDDQALLARGVRGRGVSTHQARELERATLQALGRPEDPPCQWSVLGPEEASPAPRGLARITLPLATPHTTPYGCFAVLVERTVAAEFERLFEVAAQELSRLLSLEEARLKIYRMAVEDALTGLPNRRLLNDLVAREADLASRYRTPFSILLVDVDNFKTVNDTLGHQTGDEVLLDVTRSLRGVVRKTDVLGRWGGDEFLVLCPHTDPDQGRLLAERLRNAVARLQVTGLDGTGLLTLSVGLSTWRGPEDHVDELFRRADIRLYEAKQQGRNQVRS